MSQNPHLSRLLHDSLKDEMPSDSDLQFNLDLRKYELSVLPKLSRQPDFVIFVVNDDEMQAALRFLQPINELQCGSFPAYFCTWPSLKLKNQSDFVTATVLLLQQGQSNGQGTHAAQALITAVLDQNRPRMIFALGCAYGWNAKVQKQFHVLLSDGLATYHKVREGKERENRNVVEAPHSIALMKSQMKRWSLRQRSDTELLEVHSGIIVSGDALIDSRAFKDNVAGLLNITEAGKMEGQGKKLVVGGEMEGAGMSAAMSFRIDEPLPWMLIKGVSDDGETKGAKEKKESDLQLEESSAGGSQPNINQRKATFAAFHFLTFALKNIVAAGKMLKHMSDAQATVATAGLSVDISPGQNLYADCEVLASKKIAHDLYEAQYAAEIEEAETNRASALERDDQYGMLLERLEIEQEQVMLTRAKLDGIKASVDNQFPLPLRCDDDLRKSRYQSEQDFLKQRERYAPHMDIFRFQLPKSEEQWVVTLRRTSKTTWSGQKLQGVLSISEYEKAHAHCQVTSTKLSCDRVGVQPVQTIDDEESEQSEEEDEGEAPAHELTLALGSSSSGKQTPMKSTKKRTASQAEVGSPALACSQKKSKASKDVPVEQVKAVIAAQNFQNNNWTFPERALAGLYAWSFDDTSFRVVMVSGQGFKVYLHSATADKINEFKSAVEGKDYAAVPRLLATFRSKA